jgi:hypothetical protein
VVLPRAAAFFFVGAVFLTVPVFFTTPDFFGDGFFLAAVFFFAGDVFFSAMDSLLLPICDQLSGPGIQTHQRRNPIAPLMGPNMIQ